MSTRAVGLDINAKSVNHFLTSVVLLDLTVLRVSSNEQKILHLVQLPPPGKGHAYVVVDEGRHVACCMVGWSLQKNAPVESQPTVFQRLPQTSRAQVVHPLLESMLLAVLYEIARRGEIGRVKPDRLMIPRGTCRSLTPRS
jgi:hypothetical protein